MITRNHKNIEAVDFQNGEVILIDKDSGLTSFKVVQKVRKAAGIKKVGHAGTLDPAATGLLIVCTGKKTKEISRFQEMKKTYSGLITLGKTTKTYDSEAEIIEEKSINGITEESIIKVTEKFIGQIEQVPPMYSALKYKGKSLYKYARKGIEIERQPRLVTIYSFVINEFDLPDIRFTIGCSKGTYIRSLANDLGIELGCGAYLKSLRREAIGEFNVEDALKIEEFENLLTVEHYAVS